MRRIVFIVTLGAVALGLSGCAGGAVTAPKPPARLPEKETRAAPTRQQTPEEPPALIAPPPAYGNKIVMAGGPSASEIH